MVVHPKLSSLSKVACLLFVTIDFCLTISVAAGGDAVYAVIPPETPYLRGGRYMDGELYERRQSSNLISLAGEVLVLEDEFVAAISVAASSSAVAVYTVIPSGAPYPRGGRNNDGELFEQRQSNLTSLAGDAFLVLQDESAAVVSVAAGDDLYTVIPRIKTPYLRGGRSINGELYERRQSSNRMSLADHALVVEDEYVAVSDTAGDAVGDALVLEDESVMVSVTAGDAVGDALVLEDESVMVSVITAGDAVGDALVLEDESVMVSVITAGDAIATVIPQEMPHPRGGGSIDGALFQCIRWVASAIAFLVWHAIVMYWAGFQQEPITTILVTVVGLAVRRHLAGPIAVDALWGRVAARAFPSNRQKRDQLKAKVWKYIVINADDDYRIEITQVQGKAIWEWVDDKAPAGLE
jgi:hypothetical protein